MKYDLLAKLACCWTLSYDLIIISMDGQTVRHFF